MDRSKTLGAPMRIGLLGFGQLARNYYVPALRRIIGIELIAVADPLVESRDAARALYPSIKTYPTHLALLEEQPLDALLIATQPSSHLQIWNDVVKRKVPIFMEKPFVLYGQLAQACDPPRSDRVLMLNLNRRFWPAYRRIRELICSGQIGRPQKAEFVLRVDVLRWCSVTSHRLSPAEGGVLYDLGSSQLDLIKTIFSKYPASITARASTKRWQDDHVEILVNYAGGLSVRCDLAYSDRNRESIMIEGSKGRVRLDDPNMGLHLEPSGGRTVPIVSRFRDAILLGYRGLRRDQSMLRYTIRASIEEFVLAVRARGPFGIGFEEAVENNIWLEAAWRSIANGTPETVDRLILGNQP
jgi:predicted dehydrogenase